MSMEMSVYLFHLCVISLRDKSFQSKTTLEGPAIAETGFNVALLTPGFYLILICLLFSYFVS